MKIHLKFQPHFRHLKQANNSQSAKDKAVVVHVFFSQNKNIEDLQEFQLLAESANVEILQIITTSRATPQAKYFIGEGKAQEIADAVKALDADVVLVNHQLTPAQTRNLESICQCRVVDRTGVILDIFAQRARSHEGKLQVELAQLKHLSTRLVRRKTGLDQQKGAVGLRGPGETQLETDRRLIKVRIARCKIVWPKSKNNAIKIAKPDKKRISLPFLWLVIPMRENRHYSISSHKPMSMRRISFLPLSIPH